MVPEQHLSEADRTYLLSLARQTIENHLRGHKVPALDFERLSPQLRADGASFVTLTYRGYLRGCIGSLEPIQSLAEDVREHALDAAFQDYRFPPVQLKEMNEIEIEISYLTRPEPLKYTDSDDLLRKIRPNMDGVVIRDGVRRATFLPQVWEKVPDPEEFLEQLCMKMGAPADTWKRKKLEVLTYQVEEFHE
ncbi:MAG: hypothetical protein C3F13_11610 [Anaerolineales bacterium]|nr:MAG: hypothetical protein C3F13_11610 [Anaerolineales bacterium]